MDLAKSARWAIDAVAFIDWIKALKLPPTWPSVLVTFLAVFVALFKEQLQSLFFKPKFNVAVGTRPPFAVKTKSIVYGMGLDGNKQLLWSGSIYWARFWVQNVGNRRAESVEVFVTKVERLNQDGAHVAAEGFIPSNLRWANTDPEKPEIFYGMNPGMGRFCDLGEIADPACPTLQVVPGAPRGIATFDVVLQTPLPGDAHRLPPGDHRISFMISAANAMPVEQIVNVSISGKWTEDAEAMFTDELGVSIPR
jgi:hypothetical protein